MMLHVLGSNSSGNSYILQNATEALIIECGVKIDRIKHALGFKIAKVAGCLVSHEHLDHSSAIVDVMSAGINCYATQGTLDSRGINHYRAKLIKGGKKFKVGNFSILPFNVKHDAMEPVGFLIHHPETGNVLFITDTYYVEYTFRDLHNVIVEANYCQEIVDARVREAGTTKYLRDRVLQSHMSLDTCIDLLKANDLSKVNNIVLVHLSDGNSDAIKFQYRVAASTGKKVTIAEKGLVMNFNQSPF